MLRCHICASCFFAENSGFVVLCYSLTVLFLGLSANESLALPQTFVRQSVATTFHTVYLGNSSRQKVCSRAEL